MVIENYMPDFAVEAAHDLTVPVRAHGIMLFWSIWDTTSQLGTTPDGTPEMKQWLRFGRGIRIIVVSVNTKNASNEQLRNLGLTTFIKFEALSHWDWLPWRISLWEKKWSWLATSFMTDIRAASTAGIRSIWSNPWSNMTIKRRSTELVSVWSEKSLKSTVRLPYKKNLTMEEILYWLWSNHSDDR